MAMTLHRVIVPGFLQTLGAVAGLLGKAEAHITETGTPPEALLGARLAPDMFDFAYQVKSCAVHSLDAVEGVLRGGFSPDTSDPGGFAALRERIASARAGLESIDPATLDARADSEVVFSMGDRFRVPFTGANFLLSFSTPNLHFHATAAYALLRSRGVTLGKRDYLGAMRTGFPG